MKIRRLLGYAILGAIALLPIYAALNGDLVKVFALVACVAAAVGLAVVAFWLIGEDDA